MLTALVEKFRRLFCQKTKLLCSKNKILIEKKKVSTILKNEDQKWTKWPSKTQKRHSYPESLESLKSIFLLRFGSNSVCMTFFTTHDYLDGFQDDNRQFEEGLLLK